MQTTGAAARLQLSYPIAPIFIRVSRCPCTCQLLHAIPCQIYQQFDLHTAIVFSHVSRPTSRLVNTGFTSVLVHLYNVHTDVYKVNTCCLSANRVYTPTNHARGRAIRIEAIYCSIELVAQHFCASSPLFFRHVT